MQSLLPISTSSGRQEAAPERLRETRIVQPALIAIFSLGMTAALVWVGCFRIREDRTVVLADSSEILSFLESMVQLVRYLE